MEPLRRLSVLDLADQRLVDVWLVFRNVAPPHRPAWRWLRHGFHHVEVWQHDGVWVRVNPCLEVTTLEVYAEAPWQCVDKSLAPTFLRVRRVVQTRKLRAPLHVGPLTCVDGAKTILGMWAPFIVTPYQLHKRLVAER